MPRRLLQLAHHWDPQALLLLLLLLHPTTALQGHAGRKLL